jgi:hypothetical protein
VLKCVTKLTSTNINLINHNRENTKNDLIVVNLNNNSTTQIKIKSCRTTQARQANNRSNHWITITRNKRKIWGSTYSGSRKNKEMEPSVKKSVSGCVSALPKYLIHQHPCRSSDRRHRLGDTTLPRSVAWWMKEWQSRKQQHRKWVWTSRSEGLLNIGCLLYIEGHGGTAQIRST